LEAATVIPRHQRVLFWILLISSVVMSVSLIRMRERAHDRLLDAGQVMPLNPPAAIPAKGITLMIANDADGSIAAAQQEIALPADPNARAHVILQHLIADYGRPGSSHPIATNNGVNEVFFLTLPADANAPSPGVMAIINLSGSFAAVHPSGIETETLTLLSMIGTLHANFPEITQVRFLVDGQPRDTLAGHADLTRIYLASGAPGVKHL
jgi:Sporulation and spore germination